MPLAALPYCPELPCSTSRWFRAQGVPVKLIRPASKPEVPVKRKLQLTKAQSGPDRISSRHQAEQTPASQQPSRLLLCDFDKTIADFDAGEARACLGQSVSTSGIHCVCQSFTAICCNMQKECLQAAHAPCDSCQTWYLVRCFCQLWLHHRPVLKLLNLWSMPKSSRKLRHTQK